METDTKKILIVDDEEDILEFVSYNLKKEGYEVLQAKNGLEAIQIARNQLPHLILLDVMMPGIDGIETCREIRNIPELKSCIIAFFTARSEDYSLIAGLDAGADDYITKPLRPRVLISKVNALLRRHNPEPNQSSTPVLSQGDLIIDSEKYLVYINGREIFLPRKEFELLKLLASKPGRVFTRDEIFNRIWSEDVIVSDRTIDVHIRKIREKLGEDIIKTVKGVGYKFEKP